MINLLIGLAALMLANILLGTSIAKLKKKFKKDKLKNGISKAAFIFAGILLMYLCAVLNPDVASVNFQGMAINLGTAMKMLFKAAMGIYLALDFKKLADIFGIKVSEENSKEKSDY